MALSIYDPRNGVEGCGNHGCRIRKVEGQGTNGPCRCLSDPIKAGKILHNSLEILQQLLDERQRLVAIVEEEAMAVPGGSQIASSIAARVAKRLGVR